MDRSCETSSRGVLGLAMRLESRWDELPSWSELIVFLRSKMLLMNLDMGPCCFPPLPGPLGAAGADWASSAMSGALWASLPTVAPLSPLPPPWLGPNPPLSSFVYFFALSLWLNFRLPLVFIHFLLILTVTKFYITFIDFCKNIKFKLLIKSYY